MNDSKPVAVITGASSGIGSIYAHRLAERGYDLVVIARRADRLEALAALLQEKHGTKTDILTADLCNEADLAKVEAVLGDRSDLTLLVNNVGIAKSSNFGEQPQADINTTLSLNVVAFTRIARAVVPGLVARGEGAIINIASALAVGAMPGIAVYVATKAYALSLSLVMQQELAESGVKVQCVLPSITATEIWDNMGLSLSTMPAEHVMTAEALVDAALAGYDKGEAITFPSVEDDTLWTRLSEARGALFGGSFSDTPASRYLTSPTE